MKTVIINRFGKAYLLCLILLYNTEIVCSQTAAGCSDTFFRKKETFFDTVSIVSFKSSQDNKFLFTGNGLFGKINNNGQLLYAKKIVASNISNEKSLFTVTESLHNIFWAGSYYETENGVYVIKTDLQGNIVNSFFYPVKYEYRTDEIVVQSIKYISDNEIYILATASMGSTGGTNIYNLLIKLDSNGNIYWSKALNSGDIIVGRTFDMYKKGAYLYLSGTVFKPGEFNNRVFIMGINGTNGDVISLNSWNINNIGFSNGNCAYNNCLQFKINDINGSLFLTFGGNITPSFSEIYYSAVKISLDDTLGLKSAIQIRVINNNNIDIFFCDAAMNNNGEFCSLFTQQADLIFCVLSKNNVLQTQRKITQPNSWPLGNFANSGLNIDSAGIIYNLSQYFTPTLNEYELIKINPKQLSTNRCLGVDTNFARVETLSFEPASFNWDSVTNDIVSFRQLNLTTEDITSTQELICYEAHTCDTLKISTTNTLCLSNPNTQLELATNPTCQKNIFWEIDNTAVQVTQNINDTLLTIKFIKPFHGYIKAGYIGCDLRDSVLFDVYAPNTPVNLGNDTTRLCNLLKSRLDAGKGYKNYTWNDRSIEQYYTVPGEGQYWVTTTDSCNNTSSDTINVLPSPDINFSVFYPDTICKYDSAFISLPTTLSNYTFEPAAKGKLVSNNYLSLFPTSTTVFNIIGKSEFDCSYSDTVKIVVKDCPVTFFIPNAFTPDKNGTNDTFKPLLNGKTELYDFYIYNRFGELVFKTSNRNEGWDGKFNMKEQGTGAYSWYCKYKFEKRNLIIKSGNVLLLK